jgi:hypothetical protein
MPRGPRRILLIAAGAVAVWYIVILFSWAVRPLSDSIPVGTDYTLKQPRLVSQDVTCHSLFASSTWDGKYPALKPQPLNKDRPDIVPLRFQREACALVQRDARIVFSLDTLGAIVVISGLLYFGLRTPKEPAGSHRDPAPAVA